MTVLLALGIYIQIVLFVITTIFLGITAGLFLHGYIQNSQDAKDKALQMLIPSIMSLMVASINTLVAYGPSDIQLSALSPIALLYAIGFTLINALIVARIVLVFASRRL